MKLAVRVLSLVILAGVALFYTNCSKDDNPGKSDRDAQIEKLNGTWTVASNDDVTLDGGQTVEDYDGFSVNITGQQGDNVMSFSASNMPDNSVWEDTGTLTFGTNVTSELLRNDDVEISYSVNGDQLIMEFYYNPTGSGRVRNVVGVWKFIFARQ